MTNGNEHTLLINEPFALRQNNGMPVYTEIKTIEKPYTEEEIDNIISNQNKQRKEKGFTIVKSFDNEFKEMLRKNPKKIRTKHDTTIDLHTIERVILTPNAKGYITTPFLNFAKEYNISIYWIDEKGKVEASFIPFYHKVQSKVLQQADARNNDKAIEISKYLISLKLESYKMEHLIPKLRKAKSIKDILQVEGNASRAYYQQWEFSKEWRWNGRHGKTSFNSNALDPINSMLNLGYSLLAQQMSEILLKKGFELSIGFMHMSETSNRYWNMLAYDFVEPYRIWIDDTIKEMIAEKEIKPKDFTFNEDKSYLILKDEPLEAVLHNFMDTLEPLEHQSLKIIRNVEEML